ncbi:MAG: hypothetical protein ACI9EW_000911 [Cellvibrionaceae bacterium]|jgi:hypothetical protein
MSNTEVETDQEPRNITWRSCVGAIIFLIIMGIIPIFACRLVTQGVLQFGNDQNRFLNIFMLQEPDQEGIGVQWTRAFDDEAMCTQSSVRYFMFVGEGENFDRCECSVEPISRPLPDMCILTP